MWEGVIAELLWTAVQWKTTLIGAQWAVSTGFSIFEGYLSIMHWRTFRFVVPLTFSYAWVIDCGATSRDVLLTHKHFVAGVWTGIVVECNPSLEGINPDWNLFPSLTFQDPSMRLLESPHTMRQLQGFRGNSEERWHLVNFLPPPPPSKLGLHLMQYPSKSVLEVIFNSDGNHFLSDFHA